MKKTIKIAIILLFTITLTGCNKYKGYWCNYDETSTIVVLLKDNVTEVEKGKIEEKFEDFENLISTTYYSKDDYLETLGDDAKEIHAAFVLNFNSNNNIGDYIDELNGYAGVLKTEQAQAKINISLYNIKSHRKYTFTNSDEANSSDLETGKYKVKNGVITFTPDDSKNVTKFLYIKDGLLCADAECNRIFAESDEKCGSEG